MSTETDRSARTFTERARRAQIVAAAIEAIADVGYPEASFAEIARRAGLSSTGLISYHFAGKADLIAEVVAQVVGSIGPFMTERMRGVSSPAEALRAYIRGNCEFIANHPTQMRALVRVFLAGGFSYGTPQDRAARSPVEEILRSGQQQGQFRSFDVDVMATLIQRAVDGLPLLIAQQPERDVAAYADEVVTVFELATRVAP